MRDKFCQVETVFCWLLFAAMMLTGCSPKEPTPQEMVARYAKAEEQEAKALAKKNSDRWPNDARRFFSLAEAGRWDEATNLYGVLSQQYLNGASPPSNGWGGFEARSYRSLSRLGITRSNYWPGPNASEWEPVKNVRWAIDQFQKWDPELLRYYSSNVLAVLPSNSVFISDVDAGFFALPVFAGAERPEHPFIDISANWFVASGYLTYLNDRFGPAFHVPSETSLSTVFQSYLSDVSQRARTGQLRRNENVTTSAGGGISVSGTGAIMQINGAILRALLTNNPGLEFHYEAHYPIEWTMPYLMPHGLVLEINHEPLTSLDVTVLDSDRSYWREIVSTLIGLEIDDEQGLPRLSEFAAKVYLRGDLSEFHGNPHFATNEVARKYFARLRLSIASVYAWRATNSPAPVERPVLAREADLAFRQAFALCPGADDQGFFAEFLLAEHRTNDFNLLIGSIRQLAPGTEAATNSWHWSQDHQ